MKLGEKEINFRLEKMTGWVLSGEKEIKKVFEFKDFMESINFVNKIAPIAEKINHHPDITVNYNKVMLILSTHDEGGITEKDLNLAEEIEALI